MDQFIYTNLNDGLFKVMDSDVEVKLVKDDVDILNVDNRHNLTMFRTNNQIISMGGNQISDECVAYSFGYKIETDEIFARIFCKVTKAEGILMCVDVTPKIDFNGTIFINIDGKTFAKGDGIFITNKRSVTDVKITQ